MENKEEVILFENEQFGKIRTELVIDEPYFCLADVCKALDLQPAKVKERLNEKGVKKIHTLTEGGNQELIFINEANLYRTILRSNKPQAEAFQDWICEEVLPEIRQKGKYEAQRVEEWFRKYPSINRFLEHLKDDVSMRELCDLTVKVEGLRLDFHYAISSLLSQKQDEYDHNAVRLADLILKNTGLDDVFEKMKTSISELMATNVDKYYNEKMYVNRVEKLLGEKTMDIPSPKRR